MPRPPAASVSSPSPSAPLRFRILTPAETRRLRRRALVLWILWCGGPGILFAVPALRDDMGSRVLRLGMRLPPLVNAACWAAVAAVLIAA